MERVASCKSGIRRKDYYSCKLLGCSDPWMGNKPKGTFFSDSQITSAHSFRPLIKWTTFEWLPQSEKCCCCFCFLVNLLFKVTVIASALCNTLYRPLTLTMGHSMGSGHQCGLQSVKHWRFTCNEANSNVLSHTFRQFREHIPKHSLTILVPHSSPSDPVQLAHSYTQHWQQHFVKCPFSSTHTNPLQPP